MPRFVVLEHDWPERHWDLLLESGDVLRAWRLLAEPGPDRVVPAEPNFDHRLMYLDYEGPLTGGRGSVTRWDWGTFEWLENHTLLARRAPSGVEPDAQARVLLNGTKLIGIATLADDTFSLQRIATGA